MTDRDPFGVGTFASEWWRVVRRNKDARTSDTSDPGRGRQVLCFRNRIAASSPLVDTTHAHNDTHNTHMHARTNTQHTFRRALLR